MMKGLPKVAVCGGGRAGTAIAGDLTFMGCQVNLFQLSQFRNTIEPIIQQGGVEITGETWSGKTGLAKLNLVTTDAEEAIKGVDLIMVAAPAFGHKAFFDEFSPHLQEGQSILINTSYWGCLRFAGKLRNIGIFDKITLAEAMIMPYLSNVVGPAATHIHKKKQEIALAAFPATKTDQMLDIVRSIYPQHKKVPNVLWTSLGNMNTPVHAPLSVPMAGLLFDRYSDGRRGGAKFYGEATTPGGRLVEAYDRERVAVARKLGIDIPSVTEVFYKVYGYQGKDLAEAMRKSEHAEMFVDVQFQLGLIEEDLRYFYASLSQLGDALGVPTPTTKAILTVMGAMLGINYWEGSTTLEDIGLAGLNKDQIVRYVTEGKV
ncbi:MAG: NAD/NADP octopine/nopaline dehydrogenase family protein [Dehalococcoidales bacterium]